MGTSNRRRARAALGAFHLAALVALSLASCAGATVTIDAPSLTHTGASFAATANASDPESVVLYEWDMDGDGSFDVNRTDTPEAGFVYTAPRTDYRIQLNLTRLVNGSLIVETAFLQVNVANGTPSVSIDMPDRLVSGVPLTFKAHASDPDSPPCPDTAHCVLPAFSYAWSVDGIPVAAGGSLAEITIDSPGAHEVAVEVTDDEGLSGRTFNTSAYAAPGVFEGKSGVVNLSLLVAIAALALGLPLVRMQRREAAAARLTQSQEAARATSEGSVEEARARGAPRKAAFGAASSEAEPLKARIFLGGTPSSLLKTRECPVCHNAVDASTPECPFCKANDEAAALEARLGADPFATVDLSEVRAIMAHARRERHLGKLERDRELRAQAESKADELLEGQKEAEEVLPRARDKLERARRDEPAGSERLDRAASYLKLAQSLASAKQYGKASRHARRGIEILEASEPSDADQCHACGGSITAARLAKLDSCPHCGADLASGAIASPTEEAAALEPAVRDEIRAIKEQVASRSVELDGEAFKLVESAEEFERKAEWAQALEVLGALREKLERARAADKDEPPPPPDVAP